MSSVWSPFPPPPWVVTLDSKTIPIHFGGRQTTGWYKPHTRDTCCHTPGLFETGSYDPLLWIPVIKQCKILPDSFNTWFTWHIHITRNEHVQIKPVPLHCAIWHWSGSLPMHWTLLIQPPRITCLQGPPVYTVRITCLQGPPVYKDHLSTRTTYI
jgi:hypothetical protein